ncbi:restriction endonuclease [Rhizobium mongolense]|uniref:restriction endonuclease n=1 Tax=Rhizobium mongolense TaxID=57676 RepID=UPI003555FD84
MIDFDDIQTQYKELCALSKNAAQMEKQTRGYRFERLINALLEFDGLDPRMGYQVSGEQIDGSFFLDGSVLLFEAKWHSKPVPASTLYQFKGKVDGKLVGTVGIFISMSGYSEEAVEALAHGKTLNLVLFGKDDMDAVIKKSLGFKAVLKRKLRDAAEAGLIYSPMSFEKVTPAGPAIEYLRYDKSTGTTMAARTSADLVIVCEGDTDRDVVSALTRRILELEKTRRSIHIITAMSKNAVPKLPSTLRYTYPKGMPLLFLVIDGDYDPGAARDLIRLICA